MVASRKQATDTRPVRGKTTVAARSTIQNKNLASQYKPLDFSFLNLTSVEGLKTERHLNFSRTM